MEGRRERGIGRGREGERERKREKEIERGRRGERGERRESGRELMFMFMFIYLVN